MIELVFLTNNDSFGAYPTPQILGWPKELQNDIILPYSTDSNVDGSVKDDTNPSASIRITIELQWEKLSG